MAGTAEIISKTKTLPPYSGHKAKDFTAKIIKIKPGKRPQRKFRLMAAATAGMFIIFADGQTAWLALVLLCETAYIMERMFLRRELGVK